MIQSPRPHGSYGNPVVDGRLRRKGFENHGQIRIFAELPLLKTTSPQDALFCANCFYKLVLRAGLVHQLSISYYEVPSCSGHRARHNAAVGRHPCASTRTEPKAVWHAEAWTRPWNVGSGLCGPSKSASTGL